MSRHAPPWFDDVRTLRKTNLQRVLALVVIAVLFTTASYRTQGFGSPAEAAVGLSCGVAIVLVSANRMYGRGLRTAKRREHVASRGMAEVVTTAELVPTLMAMVVLASSEALEFIDPAASSTRISLSSIQRLEIVYRIGLLRTVWTRVGYVSDGSSSAVVALLPRRVARWLRTALEQPTDHA